MLAAAGAMLLAAASSLTFESKKGVGEKKGEDMTRRMNWDRSNKLDVLKKPHKTRLKEIRPDKSFWQLWREDKNAMKDSGYLVIKKNDGWHVYLSEAVLLET